MLHSLELGKREDVTQSKMNKVGENTDACMKKEKAKEAALALPVLNVYPVTD